VSQTKVHVRFQSVLLVICLILAAIGFTFTRDDDQLFSIFFAAFILANAIGWIWILYITRPVVRASREAYSDDKDYFGLAELEIVNAHMAGLWQWWRFGGMFLIVAAILIVSWSDNVRQNVADFWYQWLPSIPSAAIKSLLPDALLILFIVFAEGVIWTMRAKMAFGIRAIDALQSDYVLERRAG